MWKFFRVPLTLLAIVPLCATLVLFNVLQMLSLALLPFSGAVFREANRLFAQTWFNFLTFVLERVLLVEFRFTGDMPNSDENAFVVANHQSQADIPALVAIACRVGRAGDLKWFVKDPLKWVPGVGWGMIFLDCLFVKRNWSADKDKILATFERLRRNQVPFWILSFVEGTRLTPVKLERAQAYEAKAGLPVSRFVMSPRTRGFEATLEGLGELTDAVYDITIAFEGYPVGLVPGLGALFFGPIERVHVHCDRFAAATVPLSKEGRVRWILERFRQKDARLARFRETGSLA